MPSNIEAIIVAVFVCTFGIVRPNPKPMSPLTLGWNDALYQYLLSVSLHESDLLRQLREETASLPEANVQIAPEQGQFMALLL